MMRLEAKGPLGGKTAHILPKRTRKPTPDVLAEMPASGSGSTTFSEDHAATLSCECRTRGPL
jgi:hypothetical protein